MGCFQRQQPALSRVQAGAERPSPLHLGTITSPCCASCCPWESRPWPSVCSRSYTVRSPAPPGWRECLMPPTVSPWGRTLVFHTSRGGLSHPPPPCCPQRAREGNSPWARCRKGPLLCKSTECPGWPRHLPLWQRRGLAGGTEPRAPEPQDCLAHVVLVQKGVGGPGGSRPGSQTACRLPAAGKAQTPALRSIRWLLKQWL